MQAVEIKKITIVIFCKTRIVNFIYLFLYSVQLYNIRE